MQKEIRKRVVRLNKLDLKWQEKICQYLINSGDKPDIEILNQFFELLSLICQGIKEEKIVLSDALSDFCDALREKAQQMIENRLKSFYAFAPLRLRESNNLSQVESLIDRIWEQYVLRYNPNIKTDNALLIKEDDLKEIMNVIDNLAMNCVSNMLNYDGIRALVEDRTGMDEEFCNYLARKIDKDYSELRLNYIVSRLRRLHESGND